MLKSEHRGLFFFLQNLNLINNLLYYIIHFKFECLLQKKFITVIKIIINFKNWVIGWHFVENFHYCWSNTIFNCKYLVILFLKTYFINNYNIVELITQHPFLFHTYFYLQIFLNKIKILLNKK